MAETKKPTRKQDGSVKTTTKLSPVIHERAKALAAKLAWWGIRSRDRRMNLEGVINASILYVLEQDDQTQNTIVTSMTTHLAQLEDEVQRKLDEERKAFEAIMDAKKGTLVSEGIHVIDRKAMVRKRKRS